MTHYSDSGFGSAPSAGSSCSYLPPPPPYRMRGSGGFTSKPQHKIHRSLSDSKYTASLMTAVPQMPLLSMTPLNQLPSRDTRGASWISLVSTVAVIFHFSIYMKTDRISPLLSSKVCFFFIFSTNSDSYLIRLLSHPVCLHVLSRSVSNIPLKLGN